ncbi:DUF664 domain-containing protein [Streptomyces roseus]|uniref:mycothiol transferase n=1 Tax=Streptomyces roseus TaxID=66430 RepID=UPI0033D671E8
MNHARTALYKACRRDLILSEESFQTLIKAAIYDPDPSFNRHFLEPALNAFGHRRVQASLLGYLRAGTDIERAGAANAWYWSALPLRMPTVRAEHPAATGSAEPDDAPTVGAEWYETALREFVSNEHLDVRRCILPGLPLRKSACPPELHGLVDAAVAIARPANWSAGNDLDKQAVGTIRNGLRGDLRWILLHLTEETARHNGHLDILRELLDGRTRDRIR